ncbi:MAG: phosphoribosylaminoimidazolecarboxamide formyltransferase [Chloroflexi bacterium]|nr:phosphoribosylaminoimidazolecarboxamide formyltransferase [Chloroflexota bacterium]
MPAAEEAPRAARDALALKYGLNPHQAPARVLREGGLPFQVLRGRPGYINLLDALGSWQLVRELKAALELPAAASFKHTSPAGAAVGHPLSASLTRAYFVEGMDLSPLAAAYARARGADRVSSYGDWVALSDVVDEPTARLLRREASDGVIAPGFEPAALAVLQEKKEGYVILQVDPSYEPPAPLERRDVFGVTFEQRRNDRRITSDLLANVVTAAKDLPAEARRDLLVGLIALKYTQSNSVCFSRDGQVIGVGAGQQSRIHCTRLAAAKADLWHLRQHPAVLDLPFRQGITRTERDNAIDGFLRDDLSEPEERLWTGSFEQMPRRLTTDEQRAWLAVFAADVALTSDAFFPFRDNLDRAARGGVRYVAQPGGSLRDDAVIAACDEYGMTMAFTGVRLFLH